MLVIGIAVASLVIYSTIGAIWAEIDRRLHPTDPSEPFTITPFEHFLFIAALWPIWLIETLMQYG